jgi:DNA-binding NarL/FixJ family response regulator
LKAKYPNRTIDIRTAKKGNTSASFTKIDQKDIKIIGLLIAGYDNQTISSELQIPLSTVQRRTRQIQERDWCSTSSGQIISN